MTPEKPRVAAANLVTRNGKLLLGKRKGLFASGMWACPGGHLEYGEEIEECAKRELFEETGLIAKSVEITGWTNDLVEGKHFVTFFTKVDHFEGEPKLLEPEKCEGWEWFDWDHLPSPLIPTATSHFRNMGLEKLKYGSTNQSLLNHLFELNRGRDWEQFHSPKNLAMDLASEVGELVEIFRWLTEKQSGELDPILAGIQKLEEIKRKYPAHLCRGKASK